jgi:hypothetical protein
MKPIVVALIVACLAGCQQRSPENVAISNQSASMNTTQAGTQASQAAAANAIANVALPDDRTPLAEPKGAIDPKSAEAAGQVVQHYGALIEQDRWTEAASYWRDASSASALAKTLRSQGLKHLEIGKPGDSEGAAGSIYVTVPVVFYGGRNRKAAEVVLRRVNDVPGSTEEQRRWHIERVGWKA